MSSRLFLWLLKGNQKKNRIFDGGVNLTKGHPPAPPKNCPISHVQKPLTVQQAVGTRALAPFPFPELASLLE